VFNTRIPLSNGSYISLAQNEMCVLREEFVPTLEWAGVETQDDILRFDNLSTLRTLLDKAEAWSLKTADPSSDNS